MIDLVRAGRDALRLAGRDGQKGRLERIHAGVAVVLPEATLGLYPNHIHLLRGQSETDVDMILPGLCARLGFVAPEDAARPGHAVLAGTEACLDRLKSITEALPSELSLENPEGDPGDAGPFL